jgi:PPOX class probable F420-dependent enzyme
MTAAERWTFLADEPRVGVVSIDAPDRGPVSSPVWFTVEDHTIQFAIDPDSRKAELMRRAGRATFCVQSEQMPYKYVTVEGTVERLGPTPPEYRRAQAVRYLGEEVGDLYIASTADEKPETWELRPQRWSSTDYGKL